MRLCASARSTHEWPRLVYSDHDRQSRNPRRYHRRIHNNDHGRGMPCRRRQVNSHIPWTQRPSPKTDQRPYTRTADACRRYTIVFFGEILEIQVQAAAAGTALLEGGQFKHFRLFGKLTNWELKEKQDKYCSISTSLHACVTRQWWPTTCTHIHDHHHRRWR